MRVLVCQIRNKTLETAVHPHTETRNISPCKAHSRKSHRPPLITSPERRPPGRGSSRRSNGICWDFIPPRSLIGAVLSPFCLTFAIQTDAQCENDSFGSFPCGGSHSAHRCVRTGTGTLRSREVGAESIKYLELSLGLHRLLGASVRYRLYVCL